jgi:twitching motility protein PilT
MINTPTIKDHILNQDRTQMIHQVLAEGFTQYHTQTFDQSVLGLMRDGLISEEEALKNCNNPNELSLKLKGILATSDRTWSPIEASSGATSDPGSLRAANSGSGMAEF